MRDEIHLAAEAALKCQKATEVCPGLDENERGLLKATRDRLTYILETDRERRIVKLEDAVRELNPGLDI